jgi:hypothetical protein
MAGDISSDYLFHFTKRFENLVSILKEGFAPNYCLENWLTLDENLPHTGIPMVCFCDIPEKFITPHKNKYGSYGIAMEKEWGVEQRITPITYVHKNSLNYNSLQTILKVYNENEEAIKSKDYLGDESFAKGKRYKPGAAEDFADAYHSLLFLFKPYIGDDFSGSDVCFYDEREWRFYPSHVIPAYLPGEWYYMNDEGKYTIDLIQWESYVISLKKIYSLKFPLSAVKAIYVKSNEEKEKIINEFGNSLLIKVEKVKECDARMLN